MKQKHSLEKGAFFLQEERTIICSLLFLNVAQASVCRNLASMVAT